LCETSTAFPVHYPQAELGLGKSLPGSPGEPVDSLGGITLLSVAVLVQVTKCITGAGIILFSGQPEPLFGNRIILRHAPSIEEQKTCIVPGTGITLFSQ
jgi:hypothetical protein